MAYPTTITTFAASEFAHTNALGVAQLVGAITSTATTIVVDSVTTNTTWPSSWFTIRIDSEVILISSRSGNSLTVATGGRGYDGTIAASHADQARVITTFPAISLEKIQSEINAIETTLGTSAAYNFVNSITNAGTGTHESLLSDTTVPSISLKGLKAGTGVTLTSTSTDITINASGGGSSLTAANEGSGAQVYNTTTSTSTAWKFRSLVSGSSNLTITQNSDNITFTVTSTGGSDNLGNHSATQNLNMNAFNVVNMRNFYYGTSFAAGSPSISATSNVLSLNGGSLLTLQTDGTVYFDLFGGNVRSWGRLSLFEGLNQTSNGIKKSVFSIASIAANSSSSSVLSWPSAWNNTDYEVFITIENTTGVIANFTNKTTSGVTVNFHNARSVASGGFTAKIIGVRIS